MNIRIWCLIFILLLTACGSADQQVLTTAPEAEANEIVSLLMRRGISVQVKPKGKDGQQTLYVKSDQLVAAFAWMREAGLPRHKSSRLGELFRKDGMVTSPFEERVRFMAGLGQEIEQMIGRMEGVVGVRVNVTLAAGSERLGVPQIGSAAVYVKCLSNAPIVQRGDEVRSLVSKSVPGLAEEAVALFIEPVMSQTQVVAAPPPPAGIDMVRTFIAILIAAGCAAVVGFLALGMRGRAEGIEPSRSDGGSGVDKLRSWWSRFAARFSGARRKRDSGASS